MTYIRNKSQVMLVALVVGFIAFAYTVFIVITIAYVLASGKVNSSDNLLPFQKFRFSIMGPLFTIYTCFVYLWTISWISQSLHFINIKTFS